MTDRWIDKLMDGRQVGRQIDRYSSTKIKKELETQNSINTSIVYSTDGLYPS